MDAEITKRPMGNEIVKWDNSMNMTDLSALSAAQMNLFTAICAQLVERETDTIKLSYSALRDLIGYGSRSRKQFAAMVIKAADKLQQFNVSYESKTDYIREPLFLRFQANKQTGDVVVKLNANVSGVLNQLTSNFTMFLQPDWVSLHSSYTKLLYLMIMQWRTSGRDIIMTTADFRKRLGIPKGYTTNQVKQRIIDPSVEELTDKKLVPELSITGIKQGRKIVQYKISFKAFHQLTTHTPQQTARITRLAEIAEAKSGKLQDIDSPEVIKIKADPLLSSQQVKQKVAEQRAKDLPDIPLVKLWDVDS